jgi:hypothetical protein
MRSRSHSYPPPRDQTKSWSDASLALQDAAATAFAPLPPTVLDGARAAKAGLCEQDSTPGLTLACPQEKAVSCCACHRSPRRFLMIGGHSPSWVPHGVRREAERHAALRRWCGARRAGAVGRRIPFAWPLCAPEPDFPLGGKAVSRLAPCHRSPRLLARLRSHLHPLPVLLEPEQRTRVHVSRTLLRG